jgi:hypothetical protein
MGALCFESGGILVDSGFLRVLGAGCAGISQSIPQFASEMGLNVGKPLSAFLVVAYDVIGGFFALNGGGIDGVDRGHVAYFAPDTLAWESLDVCAPLHSSELFVVRSWFSARFSPSVQ